MLLLTPPLPAVQRRPLFWTASNQRPSAAPGPLGWAWVVMALSLSATAEEKKKRRSPL